MPKRASLCIDEGEQGFFCRLLVVTNCFVVGLKLQTSASGFCG